MGTGQTTVAGQRPCLESPTFSTVPVLLTRCLAAWALITQGTVVTLQTLALVTATRAMSMTDPPWGGTLACVLATFTGLACVVGITVTDSTAALAKAYDETGEKEMGRN